MLSYFKKNDPYRIVGLLMILIVTRITFFFFFKTEDWVLTIDSEGPLSNETIHSGPITNLLFMVVSFFNTEVLDTLLAGTLILLNGILLNSIFIRNASFQESSYVPASMYIILMSASKDFYHLSPALVGSSFLLISLNFLFYHIKYRGTEENIISTGFTIGLAALCYYPFMWIYIMVLIIYLLYSGTITRRYFLLTWGFVLPLLITWLIFFVLDKGDQFLNTLFSGSVDHQILGELLEQSLIVYGFALALSLVAAIQNFAGQGMTNHQILVQKAMSWVGFFGILAFAIFGFNNLAALVLVIPAMAYFCTKLFADLSKKYVGELLFLGIVAVAIATIVLGY
ncbi:DUF6427 family protein [Roseivirga sp. E12]|uniref:DUF6427 family protein n=1 Tax=Roseivirga sp. E12 TaxID=2819237 RepID=UPI001ABC6D09|nr:DUF6427 family protein [Roseivirga sp. E12]MBO3698719.1 hypothetical protein [Roseivirga sp. E12]